MTVFKIGQTKVKISPLTFVCLLLWTAAGELKSGLTLTFALILHECAHLICAFLLGKQTESIELYPFGGEAKIVDIGEFPALDVMISTAGPVASFILGYASGCLFGNNEFQSYSYTIAFLNMLPIFPLDGGRIIAGVLNIVFGKRFGGRISKIMSVVLSAAFLIYCICRLIAFADSSYIISAAFLFFAACKAKESPFLPHKRKELLKNTRNVKIIKAYQNDSLLDIAKRFDGNFYNIVLTVDDNEHPIDIFTEAEILDKMLSDAFMP